MAIHTWNWRALWAGAAALTAVVGACKGDDPIERYCEQIFGCDCQPLEYSSISLCASSLRLQEDVYATVARTYGLAYDGSCLEARADAVEAVGCQSAAEVALLQPACSYCAPVHGDQPVGAACMQSGPENASDCAQGLACVNGVCSDPCARIAAGQACLDMNFQSLGICADGTFCDNTSRQCRAYVGEGQACPNYNECMPGLTCNAAVCVGLPGPGEPCPSGACAEGASCNGGTCEPPPGIGEPCFGVCAEGAYCNTQMSTCYPLGTIGDPCIDFNGCVPGAYCGPTNVCEESPASFCGF